MPSILCPVCDSLVDPSRKIDITENVSVCGIGCARHVRNNTRESSLRSHINKEIMKSNVEHAACSHRAESGTYKGYVCNQTKWHGGPCSVACDGRIVHMWWPKTGLRLGVDRGRTEDDITIAAIAMRAVGVRPMTLEDCEIPPGTSPIAAKMMIEAKKAGLMKEIQETHAAMQIRGPAWPQWEQKLADPDVKYIRLHAHGGDNIYILALNKNHDGYGRIMSIPGEEWLLACRSTNARKSELAITDDDLETALTAKQLDGEVSSIHPIGTAADDARLYAEEATELEMELFNSDPDVMAHVRKHKELGDVFITRRFEEGLAQAYVRACNGFEPEAGWLRRSMGRMRDIITRRDMEAEEAAHTKGASK